MGAVGGIDELFEREYPRLVRSLGVAFGVEEAADAVQAVAGLLDVVPGTVKSNLHDARARLRKRLEVEQHD
jgi:hypothetical protein